MSLAPTPHHATDASTPTHSATRPDTFVAGEGARLTTASGDTLLDLTAGLGPNALGHAHPALTRALTDSAAQLGLDHTPEQETLRARLIASAAFAVDAALHPSASHAVEAALKVARAQGGPTRQKVVALRGSYHGRTLGALAASDRPADHRRFGATPGPFKFAPFNDAYALKTIDTFTSAVLVEPVQSEGGVRAADPNWLQDLRHRCDQTDALLIVDESRCGLGRTGALWAHTHAEVHPDLLVAAGPLGGGLPLAALLLGAHAARDLPAPGPTTPDGAPVLAPLALAALDLLEDPALHAQVTAHEAHVRATVQAWDHPAVRTLRGRGLLLGLHLRQPAGPVVRAARERGLRIAPARGNVIRVLPPLTIPKTDLDRALELLRDAIDSAWSTHA